MSLLEQARAGYTIVTGSHRLARVLQQQYAAAELAEGRQTWRAPDILHWGAWMRRLWDELVYSGREEGVALGPQVETALWERIIAESEEGRQLLHLPATAEAARDSWALVQEWRIERQGLADLAAPDTEAFLRWANTFEQRCQAEGFIPGAALASRVGASLAEPPDPARVVLAGFDELTPQQVEFNRAFQSAGGEIIVSSETPSVESEAVRCAFPHAGAEITAAARWARQRVEAGAMGGVAVVFRALQEQRSEVERIFTEVLDPPGVLPGGQSRRASFNISAPPPLSSWPVIQAAILGLRLQPGANDLTLVSRFLRSPWFGDGAEFTRRAAVDEALRRAGLSEVTAGHLKRRSEQHGCQELRAALGRWTVARGQVPNRQTATGWARTFSELLNALRWPGSGLSSADFQAAGKWKEMLSEFAVLELVLPPLEFGAALANLQRMAAATPFQPETEGAAVQVLGILETVGLQFDDLWVAGLDDESWPSRATPDPFIPITVQGARNLPHSSAARELEFARRRTERLLASTRQVVVSHSLQREDRELRPSPLIRGIPERLPQDLGLPDYPTSFGTVRDACEIQELADFAAPPLDPEATAHGGARIFEYQASCPFRAFAELRLSARPLDSPEPGLSPAERGKLVHEALQILWGELRSRARLVALGAEVSELIGNSILRAMDALSAQRGQPLPPRLTELETCRVKRLMLDWLDVERQRAPFTVREREYEREIEFAGVRARARIDRIDQLGDGREVIIDYKTGRLPGKPWDGDRPDQPQLPLYAVTHAGAPLAGVVFGSLRAGAVGFKGCQSQAGETGIRTVEPVDLAAKLGEWRRVLEKLAGDFRNGVADVDPKNAGSCRHCDLAALCRINEADIAASALDAESDDA